MQPQNQRPAIGKPKSRNAQYRPATTDGKPRRHLGLCGDFRDVQNAPGRFAILPANRLGKTRARPKRVIQHIFRHKGATALFHANNAARFQFFQSTPDSVAIDRETFSQHRFSRQSFPRLALACGDIRLHRGRDLAPQRNTGAACQNRVCH